MRFLALFLLLSPFAHAERPATHGMLVVGKGQIFLSHLPMYHAPHDRQVIFSAEFDAAGKAALQKSQAENPETVYTFVPEPFVLGDLLAHPHPIRGDLYRGHFEREGLVIAKGVTAFRLQVVFAQKLERNAPVPEHVTYLAFGNAQERFLAHVIGGAPNFDEIVAVDGWPALGTQVSCGELGSNQALAEGQSCTSQHALPIRVRKKIYLEESDLGG